MSGRYGRKKKGTVPKRTCLGRGEGCTLDMGHRGECMPQRMPNHSSGGCLGVPGREHAYTWERKSR